MSSRQDSIQAKTNYSTNDRYRPRTTPPLAGSGGLSEDNEGVGVVILSDNILLSYHSNRTPW